MKKLFLSLLNKALLAYIQLDPESVLRIKSLQGHAITLEILPFHFSFQCYFADDTIYLLPEEAHSAVTKISGTPLQLLGVMINKDNRQGFFADDVKIEGDAAIGQQVIHLFDKLYIDWEEFLSTMVGDIPAYHVGQIRRRTREWLQHLNQSFSQNVNEYVHEEAQWFPSREALNDLFNEIDVLRMDVDRLQTRIAHLAKLSEEKA